MVVIGGGGEVAGDDSVASSAFFRDTVCQQNTAKHTQHMRLRAHTRAMPYSPVHGPIQVDVHSRTCMCNNMLVMYTSPALIISVVMMCRL